MTNRFKIKVADLCVDITTESISSDVFRDYLLPENITADISISVGSEDITYEKEIYLKCCEHDGTKPENFDDRYFEFSAILRCISEQLPFYDGFTFHGSAVCVDDYVYIFTARSGVGKSTHAALWRQYLGDKAVMINDDKPFLRIKDGSVYAYGSPWNGKHNLSTPIGKPVKAICILERSTENNIREIPFSEISNMFIQQSLRPRKSDSLVRLIQVLDDVDKYVKFYRMGCNTDIAAAKMSYEFMSKN